MPYSFLHMILFCSLQETEKDIRVGTDAKDTTQVSKYLDSYSRQELRKTGSVK